jgi:hypothetical protein
VAVEVFFERERRVFSPALFGGPFETREQGVRHAAHGGDDDHGGFIFAGEHDARDALEGARVLDGRAAELQHCGRWAHAFVTFPVEEK